MRLQTVHGSEARPYLEGIARLRIDCFSGFPYLYDGSLEYERQYLETYFSSPQSCVSLLWEKGHLVACSTSVALEDELPEVRAPFEVAGFPLNTIAYLGEVLVADMQSQNTIVKKLLGVHEMLASSSGRKTMVFMEVDRPRDSRVASYVKPPQGYRSPEAFWRLFGYYPWKGMKIKMTWPRKDLKRDAENILSVWGKVLV